MRDCTYGMQSAARPLRSLGFEHGPRRVPMWHKALPRAGTVRRDKVQRSAHLQVAKSGKKEVWVECSDKATLTASLEAGVKTFIFPNTEQGDRNYLDWSSIARFDALEVDGDGLLLSSMDTVGRVYSINTAQDLKELEAKIEKGSISGTVVMDATAWKVIPAENLVALVQAATASSQTPGSCRLLAVATSASEAELMLGALESGTDGVLLRTNSPAEVRSLMDSISARNEDAAGLLEYDTAVVTRVEPVAGTGDRVCVDLACNMNPGEGMLVGNFSRGLFLVHSECEETSYINSRPFRVNAGPVHAYVHAPRERTAYLSELCSGSEVVVVDPSGRQRTALVGRIKIESRPLVLVEAVLKDDPSGRPFSVLLQNAETVKMVGPSAAGGDSAGNGTMAGTSGEGGKKPWQAISVVSLKAGDLLYVLAQKDAKMARHIGIPIKESITER